IVENAVLVKDKIVIKDPKTVNGTRKLEIPGVLMELLERERESYAQRKIEYGSRFHDHRNSCLNLTLIYCWRIF
ncbi:MAG: hypothetical protein LBU66_06775, partial [Treponema sp.]|nr:hypothetical protein [Treponema sp.]